MDSGAIAVFLLTRHWRDSPQGVQLKKIKGIKRSASLVDAILDRLMHNGESMRQILEKLTDGEHLG